jgi:hypothetical protein
MADVNMQVPPGLVVVPTYGSVKGDTFRWLWELRAFSEKHGLNNAQWMTVNGALVEKARNDAVRIMLNSGAQWLMQIDGDMVGNPDALLHLLSFAFQPNSPADVVGGYCTLKGEYNLPTIDTGTGTWESIFPGQGPIEAMRTGAAFLLAKRHVFERIPDPWFRMRVPARPLDFMFEVDNWARMKCNGENPFRGLPGGPWERLEELARSDPSAEPGKFVPAEVGEDSGFCDRVKAAGMRIFVHTDVVIGHLEEKVLGPADHKKAIDGVRKQHRQLAGMTA